MLWPKFRSKAEQSRLRVIKTAVEFVRKLVYLLYDTLLLRRHEFWGFIFFRRVLNRLELFSPFSPFYFTFNFWSSVSAARKKEKKRISKLPFWGFPLRSAKGRQSSRAKSEGRSEASGQKSIFSVRPWQPFLSGFFFFGSVSPLIVVFGSSIVNHAVLLVLEYNVSKRLKIWQSEAE